jgi:hypothetical protein
MFQHCYPSKLLIWISPRILVLVVPDFESIHGRER